MEMLIILYMLYIVYAAYAEAALLQAGAIRALLYICVHAVRLPVPTTVATTVTQPMRQRTPLTVTASWHTAVSASRQTGLLSHTFCFAVMLEQLLIKSSQHCY
eukprot:6655-Heterococcus_DN1.PRE.2